MSVLAFDVGGANIKAADGRGYTDYQPYPLWQDPHGLVDVLRSFSDRAPCHDAIGLTMTGELADCFLTKREGVEFITGAVVRATTTPVYVYQTDGQFRLSADRPVKQVSLIAASNWHALANYALRFIPRAGLLIDIGSTTTDIVPLQNGQVAARGQTDHQRLRLGELVYTGVRRSAVNGLVDSLRLDDADCPVMNEQFATAMDVYALLGRIACDESCTATADGRPLTPAHCMARLARLIGLDGESLTRDGAIELARQVNRAQVAKIQSAVERVARPLNERELVVVASGEGEFLVPDVLPGVRRQIRCDIDVTSLGDLAGSFVSRCATAHAVAILLGERLARQPETSTADAPH